MTEDTTNNDCTDEAPGIPAGTTPDAKDAVPEKAARLMYEAAIERDGPEPVDGDEFFAWLKDKNGTGTLYDGDTLAEDFKRYQEECRIARLLNEAIAEVEAGAESVDGEEFLESLRIKYGPRK